MEGLSYFSSAQEITICPKFTAAVSCESETK